MSAIFDTKPAIGPRVKAALRALAEHASRGQWSAVNRFSKRGPLKGCWLVDPDGERVAVIMNGAIAGQIAAAMNMTTVRERTDFCAGRAGYRRATRSTRRATR